MTRMRSASIFSAKLMVSCEKEFLPSAKANSYGSFFSSKNFLLKIKFAFVRFSITPSLVAAAKR